MVIVNNNSLFTTRVEEKPELFNIVEATEMPPRYTLDYKDLPQLVATTRVRKGSGVPDPFPKFRLLCKISINLDVALHASPQKKKKERKLLDHSKTGYVPAQSSVKQEI